MLLGCRQVVRHWVLVPALGGSNPSTPAIEKPPGIYYLEVFLLLGLGLEFSNAHSGGEERHVGAPQGNKLSKTCFRRCFFGVAERDRIPPPQPKRL